MIEQIEQLEEDFERFGNKVGRLQGEFSTLKEQQEKSEKLIFKLNYKEEIYTEAVQLLSLVQQVTRDKVKEGFEKIVTHALNYIFESDKYQFELVFGQRGNLQELNFATKTPDKTECLNSLDTDAGGVLNVISLALRVVLMEVATPKIKGFIVSDESFANLSENYIEKASQFLKEINKKMGRQIIAISHQEKMINSADKLIEVK